MGRKSKLRKILDKAVVEATKLPMMKRNPGPKAVKVVKAKKKTQKKKVKKTGKGVARWAKKKFGRQAQTELEYEERYSERFGEEAVDEAIEILEQEREEKFRKKPLKKIPAFPDPGKRLTSAQQHYYGLDGDWIEVEEAEGIREEATKKGWKPGDRLNG